MTAPRSSSLRFKGDPARVASLRAQKSRTRYLSTLSVALTVGYIIFSQRNYHQPNFVIHNDVNHDDVNHDGPTEGAGLEAIELESPILQPLRNITKPIPFEEDAALIQELRIIKDVDNWRVLGDIDTTGTRINDVGGTNEPFTNEASIAFFVQLAESNILMAPRLLSRVWHPGNVYCFHFDSKIPIRQVDLFIDALKSNPKLSNVIILPSVPVTYSGISMLLNTLESMEALGKVSQKWDYYINLSGSAYPLVSATGIRRLLGRPEVVNSATSFVHFTKDERHWKTVAAHRFDSLHFDLSLGFNHKSDERILQTNFTHPITQTNNLKIHIAKGEAWIIAHRSFCDQATHGPVARRLIALFANMQSTPEHFFQTLAWNHKDLNKTVVKSSFHSVVWGTRNDQTGGHPAYLDRRTEEGSYDFWPYVLEYSPYFFARKFRVPNSKLLDHIDTQKSGITHLPVNLTAVSSSFMIVEKRFSCLMNNHFNPTENPDNRLLEHRCIGTGWQRGNCNEGDNDCVGHFSLPLL